MSSAPTPDDDEFVSISEAARLTGVNHATVGRWASGKTKNAPVKAVRFGGRYVFRRAEVTAYVRKQIDDALRRLEPEGEAA